MRRIPRIASVAVVYCKRAKDPAAECSFAGEGPVCPHAAADTTELTKNTHEPNGLLVCTSKQAKGTALVLLLQEMSGQNVVVDGN